MQPTSVELFIQDCECYFSSFARHQHA